MNTQLKSFKTKSIWRAIAFVLLAVAFGACGNENLKTVTTQASDNYNIVILSESGAVKQGAGKFYIEFRRASDNQPEDVGNVNVKAEMSMPGMPMVNEAEVTNAGEPGRYSVKYKLDMSGTWTLNVKFDGGKSATLSLSVS